QVSHREGWADPTARVVDTKAVGGICELCEWHPYDCGHLRVRGLQRRRLTPPRDDRRHHITAWWQPQCGQRQQHVDSRRVETGLFHGFTQRGRDRAVVTRIGGTAGERGLTCVVAQVAAALD